MKRYTFYSRDMSANIDGAVFSNHLFQTTDEQQADRLRKSFYFNRSFSEIDTPIDDIPEPIIEPVKDKQEQPIEEVKEEPPIEEPEFPKPKKKKEGKK